MAEKLTEVKAGYFTLTIKKGGYNNRNYRCFREEQLTF